MRLECAERVNQFAGTVAQVEHHARLVVAGLRRFVVAEHDEPSPVGRLSLMCSTRIGIPTVSAPSLLAIAAPFGSLSAASAAFEVGNHLHDLRIRKLARSQRLHCCSG